MTIFLVVLLLLSLAGNGWQWYRWHSYRARPAGMHSHTGMMQAIRLDQPTPISPEERRAKLPRPTPGPPKQ